MQTVDKYKAYAHKLIRNPDDVEALVSQFSILSDTKENAKSYLPLARRAYELAPDQINVAMNYASALHRAGEFEQALKLYQKCAKVAPFEWKGAALHHVGISYRSLNENKKAIEFYDQAIAITGRLDIMKDRALAMMADGQLLEGLKAFEVRREISLQKLEDNGGRLVAQQRLPKGVVHWEGQDLTGKTITVYHEEGSGDFMMFCRFIPKLRDLNPAKILICGPVPDLLDFVVTQIDCDGIVPLEDFESDYVIGSMSLPWRLGITLKDVSGKPYFRATKKATFPLRGALNVGLVWRGNPAYGMDMHRSMPFSEFTPLFDLPGVAYYAIQPGPASLELTNLGFDGFVANIEPLAKNWTETAGLIDRLDCLVTVDTACGHMAGALGKPCFTMLMAGCDWRWNRNSQKTIWYDSVRTIRQKKQDEWRPVVLAVREQLKEMSLGRSKAA